MGRCTGIMWYRHHGRREAEARWPTCRACLTSSAGGPRRKRRLRSSCAKINWGVAAAACARLLAVRVELAEMSICLAVLFLGFGSVKPAQHPASCAVWGLGVQMWVRWCGSCVAMVHCRQPRACMRECQSRAWGLGSIRGSWAAVVPGVGMLRGSQFRSGVLVCMIYHLWDAGCQMDGHVCSVRDRGFCLGVVWRRSEYVC